MDRGTEREAEAGKVSLGNVVVVQVYRVQLRARGRDDAEGIQRVVS